MSHDEELGGRAFADGQVARDQADNGATDVARGDPLRADEIDEGSG